MTGVWDLILLVLASSAVLDVWVNGSLFASARAILQLKADEWGAKGSLPLTDAATDEPAAETEPAEEPNWLLRGLFWLTPCWLAELASCTFCSSYHVPWLLLVGCYVPSRLLGEPWNWLALLPLYSLAATRVGNLLNGLLPKPLHYEREHND